MDLQQAPYFFKEILKLQYLSSSAGSGKLPYSHQFGKGIKHLMTRLLQNRQGVLYLYDRKLEYFGNFSQLNWYPRTNIIMTVKR